MVLSRERGVLHYLACSTSEHERAGGRALVGQSGSYQLTAST